MSNQSVNSDGCDEEFEGIVIVGGGIGGLSTALALHRFGLRSLVLERAETLRTTGAALTLMTNAWRALHYLGVADSIRRQHPQLQGAQVTSIPSGFTKELSHTGPGKCGNHELRAVQRSILLGTLAKELPAGTIRFNSKVVSIQQCENSSLKTIQLRDGAKIKAKVLIGCDGVNSVVAEWIGLQAPSLSGRSAIRGLATFPEGHKFENKVVQYWGDNLRVGFVPCNDKDVYWFITQKSHPHDSDIAHDPERILEFSVEKLGDFPEPIIDIVKKSQIDTLTLAPLCLRWPWAMLLGKLSKENVCVVGDAMHPMTPDLGQGGGATLEDAVVLGRCLGKALTAMNGLEDKKGIEEALNNFVEERRWRAFWLISGAYLTGLVQQGYGGVIMRFIRDKFLAKKLSENILNQADFDCGELGAK
uniref:TSA: Wollemia nobilis Ref_Wollemi_Transcript_25519_1577 transcribed RNA sequence n=1 Tax=Wollemia nobilis TaxID=56998 RepID=A0A0C9S1E9_9CONI